MVYITGDIHGDYARFTSAAARRLKKGDTLIVLGDFGFLWDGGRREAALLKKIAKRRYTVLFLDGVHENFDLLDKLPQETLHGGRVRRAADSVFQLMRGEIYAIEGETYFVFGGGDPPTLADPDDRRWERAFPAPEELISARRHLEAHDNKVDYILTHMPSDRIGGYINHKVHTAGINVFLTAVENSVTYTKWYFGSLHIDRAISQKHRAVFCDILPAGPGGQKEDRRPKK